MNIGGYELSVVLASCPVYNTFDEEMKVDMGFFQKYFVG